MIMNNFLSPKCHLVNIKEGLTKGSAITEEESFHLQLLTANQGPYIGSEISLIVQEVKTFTPTKKLGFT